MRRLALGLLTASLLLGLSATSAGAGGARAAATPAHPISLGFMDNEVAQFTDPLQMSTALSHASQAGASVWGLAVFWAKVAPTAPPSVAVASDPSWSGYDWTATDAAVRAIVAAGMQPLAVVESAPPWAEGPNRPPTSVAPAGSWEPSASWLAAFATALAKRYSGTFPDPLHAGATLPAIHDWEPWNEPNLFTFLMPQWQQIGGSYKPASPGIYRRLLNAFYSSVKAVAPHDVIAAGTTAPFGDPPGGARMAPALFWRDLLCISDETRPRSTHCLARVHFDAISHHPYPVGPPTYHAVNPDDVSVSDLSRITRLIPVAERAGTLLPKGPKPLWITEISWESYPDPNGLSLADQALDLEGAIDVLYHEGASMFIWFDLRDKAVTKPQDTSLQCGVYLRGATPAQDVPKPSLTAFEFPFTAYRKGGFARLWGLAPTAGPVAIQEQEGTSWVTVRTLTGGPTRIFNGTLLVGPRTSLRAVSGSAISLIWTTS